MAGVSFSSKESRNPFKEQVAFFRNKLNLPTERWDDIQRAAHDRAFIVAGAAKADLLEDLRQAVDRAISEGKSIQAFRKEFNQVVLRHGWVGWTGEGSKAGFAWRTRVIYQTNMATSYAAGRWRQLNNPALLAVRPFWKYVHADGVMNPRPQHVTWNGLVLHHTDEFWRTHFPPNGWGCHCRVEAVDQVAHERAVRDGKGNRPEGWDRPDFKTGAPVGIDKGFDYAPGASAQRPLKEFIDEKLIRLSAPIGSALYRAMAPVLQAERAAAFQGFLDAVLADPVKRGRMEIVGAVDRETLTWLVEQQGIVPASSEIAVPDALIIGRKALRHEAAGDALSAAEWARLPAMIDSPEQILFDTRSGKLLYVAAADDGRQAKIAVEFDYKVKRTKEERNMLVSAFKLNAADIAADIASGVLRVIGK